MSKLFMTVGTTSFDEAILAVLEDDIIELLKQKGYTSMTIQAGSTKLNLNSITTFPGFSINYYKYKSSILDDILEADFVISHAGAGSCIEILNYKKPLLVIVNEKLMGNHQIELANALQSRGCLHYCTCSNIKAALNKDYSALKAPPPNHTHQFVAYLNQVMGF